MDRASKGEESIGQRKEGDGFFPDDQPTLARPFASGKPSGCSRSVMEEFLGGIRESWLVTNLDCFFEYTPKTPLSREVLEETVAFGKHRLMNRRFLLIRENSEFKRISPGQKNRPAVRIRGQAIGFPPRFALRADMVGRVVGVIREYRYRPETTPDRSTGLHVRRPIPNPRASRNRCVPILPADVGNQCKAA